MISEVDFMKKRILALLICAILLIASMPTDCSALTITLPAGQQTHFSGTVYGYAAQITGYQQTATLSGAVPYVWSIAGRDNDNSNTKVVSVMVSATPVTHTSYVWIETRNGTVISGLSQATTSLGHGVVAKKTKVATSVGSIDMYAMGTIKYSDVTYVGSTTIFGG